MTKSNFKNIQNTEIDMADYFFIGSNVAHYFGSRAELLSDSSRYTNIIFLVILVVFIFLMEKIIVYLRKITTGFLCRFTGRLLIYRSARMLKLFYSIMIFAGTFIGLLFFYKAGFEPYLWVLTPFYIVITSLLDIVIFGTSAEN